MPRTGRLQFAVSIRGSNLHGMKQPPLPRYMNMQGITVIP